MITEDDRKELAAQIDEFSKLHHGDIAVLLEGAHIHYRTWRRAAQCTIVSDVEFKKIAEFLSEHSLGKSEPKMGSYFKNELADYYGFYNMYRPNSVDETRIEVFRAAFKWDKVRRAAVVVMQDHGGSSTEFMVYKPKGEFLFLRGAVEGWSSLYALGKLWPYKIADSEIVNIMTGVCVAMDYADCDERSLLPIVFPIVLEKLVETGFSEYREEIKPSPQYERLRRLLEVAVRDNVSATEVWSRFAMPGNSNGGPRTKS